MHVDHVTPHLHFVTTEHVNWVIYAGPDGLVLIDSGYVGQRALLEESLAQVGASPGDVDAVLVTHGHADHLGGASWLAAEHGVPVYTSAVEVPHVRRERLEQVGPADVARNAFRPGVVAWAVAVLPLLDRRPALAVPEVRELPLRDGRIDVAGRPTAIVVPGHTTGHTVYAFPEEDALIVGDALVTGHRTSRRTGWQMLPTMFHHDRAEAGESLARVAELSAEILLPGHGPGWRGDPADAVARALA